MSTAENRAASRLPATDFCAAYEAGAATTIVSERLEGVLHVQVPAGAELVSLEPLRPAPTRIKASPEFHDLVGFLDYTQEFAAAGTRVFVDADKNRLFTVFDAHAPGHPAWGDHCASLRLKRSPEWERFCAVSGKGFAPMALAEFIEENLEYFQGPIAGADLLTMAQNLKVTLKGNIDVQHSTQSGLRHLQIKDDSVLAGRVAEKELSFPERVDLKLRVYEGHTAYAVSVFLRYRAKKDGVSFWFSIPDRAGIEEAALDNIIEHLKAESGLKVLKGRYQGPSHQ